MTDQEDTVPLHDPLAELERHLMSAFVAGAGYGLQELLASHRRRGASAARRGVAVCSAKLSEIEARSQYVHHLHGELWRWLLRSGGDGSSGGRRSWAPRRSR
jgi:hypothetical protein